MSVLDDVKRTAVNQRPHGGTNYPLTGPGDFSGVVLDAYVSYYDPTDAYPLPFSLDVAGTTVTVYAADLTVVTQFDTAAAVTRAWGTRTVYEWYADPVVLRLVLASAFVDGRETLDPRTCNRLTRHVRSIRVGLFRMTGNVRFESGYNVPITGTVPEEPVEGGRYAPQVAMDAVPGGGAGRLDGCDDVAAVVKRINRVGPDCSGNFRVEYDDCFRAQLPLLVTGNQDEERTAEYAADDMTSSAAQHAVKLYSDCHPCCECDYYVRTYRGLKRLWNIWKSLAADAETVRDTYDANVVRWNEARACKFENPARLVVSGSRECKTSVGASFCNFTTCCLTDVEIRFTFQRYKAGELVAWGGGTGNDATITGSFTEGEEPYAPQVAANGQVYRFFFESADAAAMSIAKLRFCTTACASDESLVVTLTVHAALPAPNPHTGDTCETPVAVVPGPILTLWAAASPEPVPASPTVRAVLVGAAPLNPAPPAANCGC